MISEIPIEIPQTAGDIVSLAKLYIL